MSKSKDPELVDWMCGGGVPSEWVQRMGMGPQEFVSSAIAAYMEAASEPGMSGADRASMVCDLLRVDLAEEMRTAA